MSGAFGKKRKMGPRERSELFVNRRNRRQMFDFAEVDRAILLGALNCAIHEGVTVSFAAAQGGIGCTLRVYAGDTADTEFAGSTEELTELLEMLVNGINSNGHDPIGKMRERLKSEAPPK